MAKLPRKRSFQITVRSPPRHSRSRCLRPPPRSPDPWVWSCHRCLSSYCISAALNRCLSCSHRFCRKCISEYDYDGYDEWKAYWADSANTGLSSPKDDEYPNQGDDIENPRREGNTSQKHMR
ncbi:hypothetical protein BDD12DRAFT_434579 [Trichophaea hybrida]|nr:hypothetical protein BDD12DRAFT_434579 [Trichophaea hybrida]